MNFFIVGLFGVYLLLVGSHGNTDKFIKEFGKDGKGFFPWIIAIGIIVALNTSDKLRPVIKPFIALALLTFFVKNFNTIKSQTEQITGLKL